MKRLNCIALIMIVLAVTGCGMQKRKPGEKQTFLLNIKRPTGNVATEASTCLTIRPCRVASPFSGRSLVYRIGSVQYEQDYYHLFLTSPDDQITEAMREWFQQAGFADCDVSGKTTSEGFTLQVRVETLCADFQNTETPVAIVQIHVRVTTNDKDSSGSKTVLEKTLTAQTPLPVKPTAAQVVEGLSDSLSQILDELEQILNTEIKTGS